MDKPKAIIVDLDGTLCNHSERQKQFLEDGDWDKFFDGIHADKVNEWCRDIMNSFFVAGHEKVSLDVFLICVTGRPERYREVTEHWLALNIYRIDDLFMRKNKDRRPDFVVKEEIYNEHIRDEYDVLFVIDDRKSVVDMWRRNGLVCLQCAEGDF